VAFFRENIFILGQKSLWRRELSMIYLFSIFVPPMAAWHGIACKSFEKQGRNRVSRKFGAVRSRPIR
jgi:hypothetical protein